MIRKLNNTTLLLILVVLLGIYGLAKYISYKKGENTFHTHIIPKIDSNKVNTMFIYPKAIAKEKPIQFNLKGKTWMVSQNGITSRAEERSERYVIQLIEAISPDHLATNDPAQWKDYDVTDTAGTRVVLLNDKDTLIDIIVGRFSYNNQLRKAMSCVRLHGQNEVYSVDGFLTMNIANEFASWRDRSLITGDASTWTKLTYTYPADSGFTVAKGGAGNWMVNGTTQNAVINADSAGTAALLKKLSEQNYGGFVDKFDTNAFQPLYQLKIENNKQGIIVLKAYPSADTVNRYIVTSSINPGAYMSGKKEGLFNSIFLSKGAFFHHPEVPKPPANMGAVPAVKKKK